MSIDLHFQEEGRWIWDDNISGVAFLSTSILAPAESKFKIAKKSHYHVSGTLFSDLRLSFNEDPKAHDLLRFRRHVQRLAEDYDDIVTLRDIKDVVIFQVKQHVSQFFLDFFYTPQVDEFLRCLILYFQHYIQTWEWMNSRSIQHANKIRLPGLRQSELRERDNLGILRLLLARSYADILLGVGQTKRFHHATNTSFSWTQRDVRLWEYLIRISGRVVWVALQRRFLHLIENEMDRMFRSCNYASVERKDSPLFTAVLESVAGSRTARLAIKAIGKECPRDHEMKRTPRFLTMSPLAHELLHGKHNWRLLGLGRIPLGDEEEEFTGLLQLIGKTEAQLASEGKVIGILGMPRTEVDTMLTITGKRAPESRSLADVLEKAIVASSRSRELPNVRSKCVQEFPRVRFTVNDDKDAELMDARNKWRKNYDKVR